MRPVIWMVALGAALCLQRARTLDEPFERDIMTYAVIGHELRLGSRLYTDVFDIKPPAVYVTFALAERVAGYGEGAVYLVNVAFALAAMAGLFAVSARWCGASSGLLAALLWLLASYDLDLQGNQPNTELCLNGLLALAFAAAFGWESWRARWGAGTLLALATLYKPIAVVAVPLWAVALVLRGGPARDRWRQAARALIALTVPTAVAWLLVMAHFARDERLDTFLTVMVDFNRDYAGSLTRNLALALHPSRLWPPALLGGVPLLLFTAVAAAARRARWPGGVPTLAYLAAAVVMVALPGRGWAHYYQLYLPPLVLGAVLGVQEVERRWGTTTRAVVASAVVALALVDHLPDVALDGDQASRRKYGERFLAVREAAWRASLLLRPGDALFVYGIEPGMYFHTRVRPVTQALWINHLTGPLRTPLRQTLRRQLRDARPAVIVMDTRYSRDWVPAAIAAWIDDEYLPLPADQGIAPFQLRLRRDLAGRWPGGAETAASYN
jgi:hypothetical protein